MITEDFVNFETAKLLKEKGFDERCTHFFKNENYLVDMGYSNYHHVQNHELIDEYSAPTLQMAMKWLREVHNFHIWVEPNHDKEGLYNAHVKVGWWSNNWAGIGYNSYERACESAIKYCLENLI